MMITKIVIWGLDETKGPLLCYADITLGHCFIVKRVRLLLKNDKHFVAMPNRMVKDGSRLDCCHPLTKTMRKEIEEQVIEKYEQAINKKPIK